MATLLSGLGNDGRRKRLKLKPQSFIPPTSKAARSLPIFHRVLVLPKQSFNAFIRHQFQAMMYSYVVYVFIGIHELAEKLGFASLLSRIKKIALRRLAEARLYIEA